MHSTIRYFISIGLLLLTCCFGFSQAKEATKKIPKPKKDFSPTGIRVGTDLIDLGKTFSGKTFQGWEVNGDIDLANYYLTADIGSWSKDVLLSNGEYSNGGNYFRIGADINLLGKFHESLTYTATSSLFPPATYQASNGSVSGGWAELTSGLRVKIWKSLWMGYTARLKFAPGTKGNDPSLATYDMPGYGIISNKPWWGFNYQVFWRFAWKKGKPVEKK